MITPFEAYRITSPYGPRTSPITGKAENHTGIDLVKKTGGRNAPIEAFVGGEVIWAKEVPAGVSGTGYGSFGLVVAVKDKYGVQHMYAHLSKALVKVGDQVKQGQPIGLQGSTGKSTGEHLHYEIRTKCEPSGGFGSDVEPKKYLKEYFAKEVKTVEKPVGKLDKAAAEKVIAALGELWTANKADKLVQDAAHYAADALRDAAGML